MEIRRIQRLEAQFASVGEAAEMTAEDATMTVMNFYKLCDMIAKQ